jgi:hypothetical protein
MAGGTRRKTGAAGDPACLTVFTVTVTPPPSVPGVNGFWLKLQEMEGCAGLELHESAVAVPFAVPTALMGIVYVAGVPATIVLLLGVGAPNEKSQVPKKLNGSGLVFPLTGSATNTCTPPLQTTSAAGTLALKLVAPEGVVARAFPLKLIVDCAVKPVPVAVSVNPVDAPLAESGLTDEKL